MSIPTIVCALEGSGALIWEKNSFDHSVREGDLFDHTVGGVTTRYKVESSILDVVAGEGEFNAANRWTTITQRVVASVVP